jgi:hypothetical protein
LTLFRDFGVDPDAEQSRETVVLVRDNCRVGARWTAVLRR